MIHGPWYNIVMFSALLLDIFVSLWMQKQHVIVLHIGTPRTAIVFEKKACIKARRANVSNSALPEN